MGQATLGLDWPEEEEEEEGRRQMRGEVVMMPLAAVATCLLAWPACSVACPPKNTMQFTSRSTGSIDMLDPI